MALFEPHRFDAFMWQGLERKARFITQIMKGGSGLRKAEDIGGQELSFAEVKAIASGNPAILTLAEMEAELQKLSLLKRSHGDDQYRARRNVKELPEDIDRLLRRAERYEADHATAEGNTQIVVGDRPYASREKAVEAMNERLKRDLTLAGADASRTPIGSYRGLGLTLETRDDAYPEVLVSGQGTHFLQFRSVAAGSLLNRVDDLVASLPGKAAGERESARLKSRQLEGFTARVGQPFEDEGRLERLHVMRNELERQLSGETDHAVVKALVGEFDGMRNTPAPIAIEAAPVIEHEPHHHAQILPFEAPHREAPSVNQSNSTGLKPAPRLLMGSGVVRPGPEVGR